jgi:hypothetical protein
MIDEQVKFPDLFCSVAAQVAGEPLAGTATRADVWLLIEHPGPWQHDALAHSGLSDPVRGWIAEQKEAVPRLREQLIRRGPGSAPAPVDVFVALAHLSPPRLLHFEMPSYADLAQLNIADMVARPEAYADHVHDEPLILVCTNARRDACCAKFGLPAFQALAALTGDSVWQTTHLGGHRFAPNILILPGAASYGHLPLADLPRLVEATRRGEVLPDRYRGRTIHDAAVQAAECFIRRKADLLRLDDLRLAHVEQTGEKAWRVRFTGPWVGTLHVAYVEVRPLPVPVPRSCGDEPTPVDVFHLVDHIEAHAI